MLFCGGLVVVGSDEHVVVAELWGTFIDMMVGALKDVADEEHLIMLEELMEACGAFTRMMLQNSATKTQMMKFSQSFRVSCCP